jgi:sigma-E factor negative regulatory protein RseB
LQALHAVAQETADEIENWLDRMNVAVEQLNYRGTYVHVVDGNAETLDIVHRYFEGDVRERISTSNGAGPEILRTAEGVRSVFPDKQLVMIEEHEGTSIPLAAMLNYTNELERYYQMTTFPKGRTADRDTQVVSIRARDEFRYGYLLWVDIETALPLKIQVRDEAGTVVESILFTELEVLDSIPEFAVTPAIDAEGFTWKRPVAAEFDEQSNEIWSATRLPNGFRLSESRLSLLAGSKYPVQHLVYSDGLATVSVFIAHPLSDADMPEGFSRFGSTNAYSLKIDGRLATAMGDVPRLTVQRIATSLDAR